MASNAFKAATLAPLALAMVACKTESVAEKEDVIELSDLQIDFGNDLKVGSTISAQAIKQGISVKLSINNGERQRKTLEELFKECKDKKTLTITITNNGKSIYTITNDILPTKGYTFETERNDFTVSVEIDDYKIDFSTTFTVGPKEQGGSEEAPIEKPNEPVDPAPQTLEYIASVSFSTALESYQEESDTDLFTELRVSVTFDGDGYSAHTETFDLENLYGWLSESSALVGGYFTFELYAGSDGTEEPLYSFSEGWFRKPSSILLNAEGTYPYRCTLGLRAYYSWEEYSGGFSVNIHPETGTPINIRSAALLWNVNADALPSPPQEVTLTAPIIRSIGDAASGMLARYKTEERLASNLDSVREHYGIDAADNAAAVSALAACIGGSVGIEKKGTRDIGNEYGVVNADTGRVYETASSFANYGLGEIYPPVIEVESYKISKGNIVLDDIFNYNEIDIENAGASISTDNAVFSMKQTYTKDDIYFLMSPKAVFDMYARLFNYDSETFLKEVITKKTELVKAPKSNAPKLDYYVYGTGIRKDVSNGLIALHKLYDDNKDKLSLDVSIDTNAFKHYADGEEKDNIFEFQGADFFKDGETMFKGNEINTSNTIPNMSADILRTVSTKYNINRIKNLVVTGDYKEAKDESVDINSYLTNVVFTGDVSGLKNSNDHQFNGIVYFMDKPYNNRRGDAVGMDINGLLKLDKLEGVSYDTFRVNYGVLDLRGRDDYNHNPLEGYNLEDNAKKAINHDGHKAIYFTDKHSENIEGIDSKSDIEDKFNILTKRVQRVGQGGIGVYNVYVDDTKYDSIADTISIGSTSKYHAVSKTPRTLEEFEYYANYGEVENPNGLPYQCKFKTPAYDSYNDDFTGVDEVIQKILKEDKDSGLNQIP
ncbi:MAG: hypothetical protein K2M50_10440 [Treponemataceae bacterium]|nr:hypothetical protein [Treponemataceae bacterium]